MPNSSAPAQQYVVLVVEDHAMVRTALAALLRTEPDFVICGEAGTPEQALALTEKLKPTVILLDYHLDASDDGARLIDRLSKACKPAPRILVMSLLREEQIGERALRAGAQGFIAKHAEAAELSRALRVVAAGGYFLSPALQAKLLDLLTADDPGTDQPENTLSEREFQILRLLGAGDSNAEIARRLGIAIRTIATHRENIRHKLGLPDNAALEAHAKRWLHGKRG